MSVIHEAVKRARAAKAAPPASPADRSPALTVERTGGTPSWVWWLMLFFVLAEGAFYLRERGRRLDAEDKMRQAYLQLNDTRGEYLEKSATAIRSSSELDTLKTKYNEALRSKAEILRNTQHVEFENLAAHKKVSDLTKKLHETEMARLRLEGEVRELKAEPVASK